MTSHPGREKSGIDAPTYVMRRGRTDAQKKCSCQLILTVPLFNVARRPRPAPHLRPPMSKPVAPNWESRLHLVKEHGHIPRPQRIRYAASRPWQVGKRDPKAASRPWKVSERRPGARDSAERQAHWPPGHARRLEAEDRVHGRRAASARFVVRRTTKPK